MEYSYISKIRDKLGNMAIFNPVVGLIICKDGKILLQKRADNNKWAIHGGGMELGEHYLDTLYREIKEELNIKPINPSFMGIYSGKEFFYIYPNGDEVYPVIHVFICEDYEGDICFKDKEVKQIQWFDLNNLPENIFEVDLPVINDVKGFLKDKKVIIK